MTSGGSSRNGKMVATLDIREAKRWLYYTKSDRENKKLARRRARRTGKNVRYTGYDI